MKTVTTISGMSYQTDTEIEFYQTKIIFLDISGKAIHINFKDVDKIY